MRATVVLSLGPMSRHDDGKPDYLCRLNRSYLKHTLALWQSEYGGTHTAVQ